MPSSLNYRLPSEESPQLLVKSQDSTDDRYGCKPLERDLKTLLEYGIVNLDKPSGPTSHEVVSWLKKILNLSNVGHGGTLDPKVTGVLPCALNKATRALSALLSAGKEYIGILYLHSIEDKKKIENYFKLFLGKIYQRPPLKSSVSRRLRTRNIYYLNLLENLDHHILFQVGCEAGTYIRKLCFDIGEAMCTGGHMLELRRTKVGKFSESEGLVSLHDLKDAYSIYIEEEDDRYLKNLIFPMEKMVFHIPSITVRDSAVDALCHGAGLAAVGVCYIDARIKKNMECVLLTLKKELIGFGIANYDAMKIYNAKSGIVVKTNKIIMERGIYPHWKKNK